MPSSHACEGSTFIKSPRTPSPGYYKHIRKILHDLNGHCGSSRMAFQFSDHTIRNHVLVSFRPGLKDCTGRVTLSRALSQLLGWPDQETVLTGRGNTCHNAPSQPRRDQVESLFVHCDLATTAHVAQELRWPRIWCCHYLPPGSLLTLGASESLSYSHVSFNLI